MPPDGDVSTGVLQKHDDISESVFSTAKFDSDIGPGEANRKLIVQTVPLGDQFYTKVVMLSVDDTDQSCVVGRGAFLSDSYEEAARVHWRLLNGINAYNDAEFVYVPQGTRVVKVPIPEQTGTGSPTKSTALERELPATETPEPTPDPTPPPPTPQDKATHNKPHQEKPQPTEDGVATRIERGLQEGLKSRTEGATSLKRDLEDYVGSGGEHVLLAALGASVLDASVLAMNVAAGIPLGFLDVRNVGEGLAKGTWEGAREDAERVLTVLPQGKVLSLIDDAITTTRVVESLRQGDLATAGMQAGAGALGRAKGGKSTAGDLSGQSAAVRTAPTTSAPTTPTGMTQRSSPPASTTSASLAPNSGSAMSGGGSNGKPPASGGGGGGSGQGGGGKPPSGRQPQGEPVIFSLNEHRDELIDFWLKKAAEQPNTPKGQRRALRFRRYVENIREGRRPGAGFVRGEQSEVEVSYFYGGVGGQAEVAYKGGHRRENRVKDSTVPDVRTTTAYIEVKNYDLRTDKGLNRLLSKSKKSSLYQQIKARKIDTDANIKQQSIVLDTRGQNLSAERITEVAHRVSETTGVPLSHIQILTW